MDAREITLNDLDQVTIRGAIALAVTRDYAFFHDIELNGMPAMDCLSIAFALNEAMEKAECTTHRTVEISHPARKSYAIPKEETEPQVERFQTVVDQLLLLREQDEDPDQRSLLDQLYSLTVQNCREIVFRIKRGEVYAEGRINSGRDPGPNQQIPPTIDARSATFESTRSGHRDEPAILYEGPAPASREWHDATVRWSDIAKLYPPVDMPRRQSKRKSKYERFDEYAVRIFGEGGIAPERSTLATVVEAFLSFTATSTLTLKDLDLAAMPNTDDDLTSFRRTIYRALESESPRARFRVLLPAAGLPAIKLY